MFNTYIQTLDVNASRHESLDWWRFSSKLDDYEKLVSGVLYLAWLVARPGWKRKNERETYAAWRERKTKIGRQTYKQIEEKKLGKSFGWECVFKKVLVCGMAWNMRERPYSWEKVTWDRESACVYMYVYVNGSEVRIIQGFDVQNLVNIKCFDAWDLVHIECFDA